jgi:hypothetical protein
MRDVNWIFGLVSLIFIFGIYFVIQQTTVLNDKTIILNRKSHSKMLIIQNLGKFIANFRTDVDNIIVL